MSFLNKFSTILRKSNKEIIHIFEDSNLKFNFFDEKNEIIATSTLNSRNYMDSSSYYFTILPNDDIYGIYNDNALKIVEIKKDTNKILIKDIMNYNTFKFDILYPYINLIDDDIHIFYYLFNNISNSSCILFHHYNKNNIWRECKIDFINHTVINNFEVLDVENSPVIFYMSVVNGYEELFFSKFNKYALKWSKPCQITNSRKNKMYLSAIYEEGSFHISFCESENNCYSVKYINGKIDSKNNFNLDIASFISTPSACMFPNIIKEDDDISVMWVDFNKIYKCSSSDFGKSFGTPSIDSYSLDDDFCVSRFFSNYKQDNLYKSSGVFSTFKDISILGI